MGRSREGKRSKQAREDIRRGLSRGNAELACGGLLALPPAERDGGLLATVGALAVSGIEHAQAQAQWSRLVPWAMRVEAEPRLLTLLDPTRSSAARWALMWGCALSGEWVRASTFWREIAPASATRRATLADAVGAWIASRGASVPMPLAVTTLAPAVPDPRLGVEPIGPRAARDRAPAMPASPGEAEHAVVRARATLGAPALAAWVADALEHADAATARAVGEAASSIALRDALARAEDCVRDAGASLQVVALCAERGVAPAAHLLTALRVALRWLCDNRNTEARAGTLTAIVRGCMRDAAVAPVVRDALVGVARRPEARDAADVLLEALGAASEAAPSASLWATGAALAMRPGDRGRDRRARPEAQAALWLHKSAAPMTARPDDLVTWMREADPRARQGVMAFVVDHLSADAAGPLLTAMASARDERLRKDAARGVEDLLLRLSVRYCASCGFEHEPETLDREQLSPAALRVLDAVGAGVWTLSVPLLKVSLERVADGAARRTLLERFVDGLDSAENWLAAVVLARHFHLRKLPAELLDRLLARFAREPDELAAAYELAWNEIRDTGLALPIARALVDAATGAGGSLRDRTAAVVGEARRLLQAERARDARRARRRGRRRPLGAAAGGDSRGTA